MGGRGGGSGFKAKLNKGGRKESSVLPDLPENMGGRIRIFHDMMNDPSARGDNDVRFTGDMHEAPASPYGYSAPGTYEVLKGGKEKTRERISGEITAFYGRLYGVQRVDEENYMVTDLRTGMLISYSEPSIYKAWEAIRTFNDGLHRERMKKSLESAEAMFKKAQRSGKK